MRLGLSMLFLACAVAPGWAAETPRYEPAPSWILPVPAIKQGAGLPVLAVLDEQTRIADGQVWSYHEQGSRAVSAQALAQLGTLKLNWQPFHGDLIVHRVDIVRDGQHISVLKAGQKFEVIRREQGLESLEMDGVLTATLQVEGLRVGDVLDVAYSVTVKDATLKGGVQASVLAPSAPLKVDFARARMLWPVGSPIRWKAHPAGLKPVESDEAGWHELSFVLPGPKQPDLPYDAPMRFRPIPVVEASSFADWEAVSAVFAPLYRTEGLAAAVPLLSKEIDEIRKRESDPKRRAAAALSLVQDRIRYFADGMKGGNYIPQSLARTWSAGYGDCKAKTLLLLAILHELGIEAEPVTANIGQGDLVAVRLTAPSAFNHIFVHARIDGEDLWMDGTGRGSRLEDLGDPPPFRWVLPVRDSGAKLVELPARAPALPTRTVTIDIDERAGLGVPAPFAATVHIRGAAADGLRAMVAQADDERLLPFALSNLAGAAGPGAVAVTQKFDFDAVEGTATITVTGMTRPRWQRQDHAYRLRPNSGISNFALSGDRARAAWKEIPVATGGPGRTQVTTRLRLPEGGKGITLEGDAAMDLDLAGRRYIQKATLSGDLLTLEEQSTNSGADLAATDLPAGRAKLAAAQGRALRLVTTPEYPAPYQQTAVALRAHQLEKLGGLYGDLIAAKPDDANRYLSRASFYAGSFQRDLALADLDKAVSLDGNVAILGARAGLLVAMGEKIKAAADYQAALQIDPSSRGTLTQLGLLQIDAGQKDAALAPVEEHLASADEEKPDWLAVKAELLARANDPQGALAALDEAITAKPANPRLLNERCWTKGTLAVQLPSALQDCTRAIELTNDNAQALDSRAMVYFRLNRLTEALADVNAALDLNPAQAGSLYLRAAIQRKMGKGRDADEDVGNARLLEPRIDEDYARWKIKA